MMIFDVEQCLLAISMYFLKKKYILRPLPNVYLVYFAIELWRSSLYILDINSLLENGLQIFSSIP